MHPRAGNGILMLIAATMALSCSLPESRPLPPDCFAFAVFGDGPYRIWEEGRFRRVIADVNQADVEFLIHVGDAFWYPCADRSYRDALRDMGKFNLPVVYTPGDNEWADCYDAIAGARDPLERLAHLRETFFATPDRSLGAHTMPVITQASDPAYAEFVENARWVRGGFVFATVHLVGGDNARDPYDGRTAAADEEVARRTDAAIAWLEEAFRVANADSLHGVVIATHGDPGVSSTRPDTHGGYGEFVNRLVARTREFRGRPVLLIHGDQHVYIVDTPLLGHPREGRLPNFTRLATFGAPDIGWVRVAVDSVRGRVVDYEPRLMKRWWLW